MALHTGRLVNARLLPSFAPPRPPHPALPTLPRLSVAVPHAAARVLLLRNGAVSNQHDRGLAHVWALGEAVRGVGRLPSCHVSHHARLLVPVSELAGGAASSGKGVILFFSTCRFERRRLPAPEKPCPRTACLLGAAAVPGYLVFRFCCVVVAVTVHLLCL